MIVRDPNKRIPVLEFSSSPPRITVVFGAYRYQAATVLKGTLPAGEKWGMIFRGRRVPLTPAGDVNQFEIPLWLNGASTRIELTAVNPWGQPYEESMTLEVPEWKELVTEIRRRKIPRSNHLSVSLGPTFLSYSQTGKADYSATYLTAKVAYLRRLNADWDVAGNVFYNTLKLTSSEPELSAAFLGVNLRAGYRLPWIRDPYSLSLLGGFYYFTMRVTERRFGFRNMMGPQIFPVLRRKLSSNESVYTYFKFSPVSHGAFAFRGLDSRELAAGLGWNRKFGSVPLAFALDYSDLKITYDGGAAHSRSLSFSVGYSIEI